MAGAANARASAAARRNAFMLTLVVRLRGPWTRGSAPPDSLEAEARRLRRIDERLGHRLEELDVLERARDGLADEDRLHHRRVAEDGEEASPDGEAIEECL